LTERDEVVFQLFDFKVMEHLATTSTALQVPSFLSLRRLLAAAVPSHHAHQLHHYRRPLVTVPPLGQFASREDHQVRVVSTFPSVVDGSFWVGLFCLFYLCMSRIAGCYFQPCGVGVAESFGMACSRGFCRLAFGLVLLKRDLE